MRVKQKHIRQRMHQSSTVTYNIYTFMTKGIVYLSFSVIFLRLFGSYSFHLSCICTCFVFVSVCEPVRLCWSLSTHLHAQKVKGS